MPPDRTAAVVLGAGFSYVGGLPLTRDLFDISAPLPQAQSKAAHESYETVRWAFARARASDGSLTAEGWLAQLYAERANPLQEMLFRTTWDNAVRYALARLVTLPRGSNAHYYYGIGTYHCHPVHQQFWERVEREFAVRYIVSLNYDILVEQALHDTPSDHRAAPRCRYGGFQHVQAVRKMRNVVTGDHELMQLGDDFVLYKLHGSVNWAWEPHSPTLKIHHDVRAVFRADNKYGVPAIVPPIPEKDMPPEFGQVWSEARKVLSDTPTWIICGYSLPDYDEALRRLFGGILSSRPTTRLIVIDPDSQAVAARWEALANNCSLLPLQGLPDALSKNWT